MILSKKKCVLCLYWLAMTLLPPLSVPAATVQDSDMLLSISPALELHFAHLDRAVLANIHVTDAQKAQSKLVLLKGKNLRYEALETDRYGRTQMVLYGSNSDETVQQEMLRSGLATYFPTVKSRRKSLDWTEDEAQASSQHTGYWQQAEHQLTPESAANAIGQPGIVEGTLTNIYRARGAYYINFGERWQDDFSIKIPRKNWRSFEMLIDQIEAPLKPPETEKDKRRMADPAHPVKLRVRGSIIQENGPMIVVTRPEQLQILGGK